MRFFSIWSLELWPTTYTANSTTKSLQTFLEWSGLGAQKQASYSFCFCFLFALNCFAHPQKRISELALQASSQPTCSFHMTTIFHQTFCNVLNLYIFNEIHFGHILPFISLPLLPRCSSLSYQPIFGPFSLLSLFTKAQLMLPIYYWIVLPIPRVGLLYQMPHF